MIFVEFDIDTLQMLLEPELEIGLFPCTSHTCPSASNAAVD